jgi:hypothetical protein
MYDILIAREYEKNGEKKTAFNKIGILFDNRNGDGWSGEIFYPSARVIIKKSKPKDAPTKSDDNFGDEIPF